VIGDDKKYLSCLMTLRTVAPGKLSDEVITYIKARGSNAKTVKEAMNCPAMNKIIQQGIDAANEKAISKAQRVQKFVILDADFSVDGGELTPTLKMKRKIINQKYEKEINSLYLPSAKL
jgi:long-chain-fatty-acid--CoA ligase ACSBG